MVKKHGLQPIVKAMDEIDCDTLSKMQYLLIITSTYGEGEMPDNAQLLWNQVSADTAPSMENTLYYILAIGDSSYEQFCQAGIDWDNRLAKLGAKRIYDRADYDIGLDEIAENWMNNVIPMMAAGAFPIVMTTETETITDKPKYNHKHPFPAKMLTKRLLTAEKSSK